MLFGKGADIYMGEVFDLTNLAGVFRGEMWLFLQYLPDCKGRVDEDGDVSRHDEIPVASEGFFWMSNEFGDMANTWMYIYYIRPELRIQNRRSRSGNGAGLL